MHTTLSAITAPKMRPLLNPTPPPHLITVWCTGENAPLFARNVFWNLTSANSDLFPRDLCDIVGGILWGGLGVVHIYEGEMEVI